MLTMSEQSIFSRRTHGMSMVQVLMAAAALGVLSIVAGKLMDGANKGSRSGRLNGIALNLETVIRGSLQNKSALSATRAATPNLNTCLSEAQARQTARSAAQPLTPGCTISGAQALSIRGADGAILSVAGSTQFLSDNGLPCTPSSSDFSCQWQTALGSASDHSPAPWTPRKFGFELNSRGSHLQELRLHKDF